MASDKTVLRKHLDVHKQNKNTNIKHVCQLCGFETKNLTSFKAHLRIHDSVVKTKDSIQVSNQEKISVEVADLDSLPKCHLQEIEISNIDTEFKEGALSSIEFDVC